MLPPESDDPSCDEDCSPEDDCCWDDEDDEGDEDEVLEDVGTDGVELAAADAAVELAALAAWEAAWLTVVATAAVAMGDDGHGVENISLTQTCTAPDLASA